MNPSSTQPPGSGSSGWMTILGILFMVLWLGASFLFGAVWLMACLMANDSGSATNDAHMAFIGGVMGGQVLTGLAGIPAGMAFFRKGRRKFLILTFLAMLAVGGTVIAVSFASFFP